MKARRAAWIVLCAGALVVGCVPVHAELRSAGIRVVVPLGGLPFLVGAEVVASMPFGRGVASFFLSPSGKTLITLSADVQLAEPAGRSETFLRLTAGLSYFDSTRVLPSLAFGAGAVFTQALADPLHVALAGEFLYPLAFPLPMVTFSGAWGFP